MKKNLISVLILALLVVNLVLTAVMMFSTMGSVKKTSKLVTDIASVLNIELDNGSTSEEVSTEVQIADVVTYDIADSLTIPLKLGADGKSHYYILEVSLMMNSKHEDYETYQEGVASKESWFKSIIIEVVGNHTLEEIQANPEGVREEILTKIQEAYNSTFIYKVAFRNFMYQ